MGGSSIVMLSRIGKQLPISCASLPGLLRSYGKDVKHRQIRIGLQCLKKQGKTLRLTGCVDPVEYAPGAADSQNDITSAALKSRIHQNAGVAFGQASPAILANAAK